MTDFGRRAGIGDMLKATYDANKDDVVDSVIGHKLTHQLTGSDQITVAGLLGELAAAQPSTWTKVTGKPATFAPSGHKTNHQFGGTDPISVAGLVGTTPRAIFGDATAGRVLRRAYAYIQDGTDANTIKVSFSSQWNADTITEQDNIVKNATTGHYSLNSTGRILKVLAAGLTGSVVAAMGNIGRNKSGVPCDVDISCVGNDIQIIFSDSAAGGQQDMTSLVDSDFILINLYYITDA